MTAQLTLINVRKRFGDAVAVDDLSLEVAAGEHLALVGPSGCGKSTLLRLIAGLAGPDEGEIRLRGELVAGSGIFVPPERRSVGIVFQDYALFPHLTVADNVAFGLQSWDRRRRRARVEEVLGIADMARHAGRYPHELSGGEQQRVALARALAPAPAAILLDEPFSNLDRNLRAQVRSETAAVLRAAGATVVLVTHDQQEAIAFGDRVAVMRAGHLEQVGTPETVFHTPVNHFVATFMGEADFLPCEHHDGQLACELGPVPAVADNGDTEVMVRPHDVTFELDPEGSAEVVGVEFQGAFSRYELRLGSGRVVGSLQPHTVFVPLGARVRVRMAHGHPPLVLVDGRAATPAPVVTAQPTRL